MIELGYWGIRGLAAPLRMMLMYRNSTFLNKSYDVEEKNSKDGFDVSAWFQVKDSYREHNPLINLPYISDELSDGSTIVITQSIACAMYLARKLSFAGRNDVELAQIEQLLCQYMDLRNDIVEFCYRTAGSVSAEKLLANISKKNSHLYKFNSWLEKKYSNTNQEVLFFVGTEVSAADFHIWEMLDQVDAMAKYYKISNEILLEYPLLKKFHEAFRQLSENQKYFSSVLAELPINNLMAHFGATPSGDRWKLGEDQPMPWKAAKFSYTYELTSLKIQMSNHSDTCLDSVEKKWKMIDIIDEEWEADCLSDDEISIPAEVEVQLEQDDDEEDIESKEDVWHDLGLEKFSIDNQPSSSK